MGMTESDFEEAVEEEISKRLCLEAITHIGDKNDKALTQVVRRWFRPTSTQKTDGVDLDVRVSLTVPVVGVGAPAAVCLPKTFDRLHSRCVIPNAYEVSVAVGAVVGMVDRTITAIIRKNDAGCFVLHYENGKVEFNTIDEALKKGRQKLEDLARVKMRQDHVVEPLFDFIIEEKKAKTSSGEEIYIETQLRLRATGRPNVWQQS